MHKVIIWKASNSGPEEHRFIVGMGNHKQDRMLFGAFVVALVYIDKDNGGEVEGEEDPLEGEIYLI